MYVCFIRFNFTFVLADVLSILGIDQLRIDGLLSECELCTISSLGPRDDLSQKVG